MIFCPITDKQWRFCFTNLFTNFKIPIFSFSNDQKPNTTVPFEDFKISYDEIPLHKNKLIFPVLVSLTTICHSIRKSIHFRGYASLTDFDNMFKSKGNLCGLRWHRTFIVTISCDNLLHGYCRGLLERAQIATLLCPILIVFCTIRICFNQS